MNNADGWVATDPAAIEADIERLGLEDAVDYQLELIEDRATVGDTRWTAITRDEMRQALVDLVEA